MRDDLQLKSIFLSAVGGQGGNLLAEWIFQAATFEGHRAQAVSLPGLSQRGGATSFYLEVAVGADRRRLSRVVFSQHPVPGEVDVIIAQEFLELARVLQEGYGSPRTKIVASTHRVYTVGEKTPAWDGPVPMEALYAAARSMSEEFVGFNAVELAQRNGLDELAVNAILLGALFASKALPISDAAYEKAIVRVGIAPEMNQRAFDLGRRFVESGAWKLEEVPPAEPWEDFVAARAEKLPSRARAAFRDLVTPLPSRYGQALARVLVEAIWRLVDYQDLRYAREFLGTAEEIHALDRSLRPEGPPQLTEIFAKGLGTWMAYEDGIRVAQLKTRAERFQSIRARLGVGPDQVYEVHEFLRPDAEEIYGILPTWLVDPLLALGPVRRFLERRHFPQHPKTTSFRGILRLKMLLLLKPLRRSSWRYRKEHALMRRYIARVKEAAAVDYRVACLMARTGQMVKGYGDTRRKTVEFVERYASEVLAPLIEFDRAYPEGRFALTLKVGSHCRRLIGKDDQGIEGAVALTRQILERAAGASYQDLLARAETLKA
ncbi:MAG: indolepyruvate oxidoreductase subunit beta family protein [Candidatus Rokubacteria bacterium]|nr:indolepyruvate oxidoreductase subunit beta family protein [Candidatus Rokubacteria bacterium]